VQTVCYFAYGSNMHSSTLRGRRGVSYRSAVPARLRDWHIVFDKTPLFPIGESFANIVAQPGGEVFGVLFEVTAPDMQHIELTEGVRIGNYQSIEIDAEPLGAPPCRATTLTSEHRDESLRPSTRYMDLLIAGAREHGLPENWIEFLRSVPAGRESALASHLRPLVDASLRAGRK
jgi:gamma-glutamylcyclotransferase